MRLAACIVYGPFLFFEKTPPTGEWEGGPKRNKHYAFIIKNL